MDLVRDVLDTQIIDRHGRQMGKVDGVVLEEREGEPPRVAYLVVGAQTALRRVHPRLARWVRRVERRLGRFGVRGPDDCRIPWSAVRDVDVDVEVDIDAEETSAYALERWLREKVIGRIPGSGDGDG